MTIVDSAITAHNNKPKEAIMANDGRGNFGNPQQHAKAGSMSSGNTGNPKQRSEAGKLGAKAQPRQAKVEGGEHSHQNDQAA